jgi:hypothetical protein
LYFGGHFPATGNECGRQNETLTNWPANWQIIIVRRRRRRHHGDIQAKVLYLVSRVQQLTECLCPSECLHLYNDREWMDLNYPIHEVFYQSNIINQKVLF